MPWGISESAFNARDLEQTYQYSSFGVPGLGLKRGLSEDLVVAPYATALAAMIEPAGGGPELRRAARARARAGRTASARRSTTRRARLPEGATVAVVQSYMAHHQGMALVALGNVLDDGAMVERFHADPIVEATELLLQERMPRDVARRPAAGRGGQERGRRARPRAAGPPPVHLAPRRRCPRTHLLSNGRYAVMVTAAGSGYSRWRDLAVTRWREDVDPRLRGAATSSCATSQSGAVWSAGHQPSGAEADSYEVDLLGGPRRVPPPRRLDRDRADDRRLGRARRRDPPRVADEPRLAGPRDRADLVRRDRARARRPPTSPTRPSRTSSSRPSSRPRSAPCSRPAGRARATSGRSGRPTSPPSRSEARRRRPVRDRPGPLPRPRPDGPVAGLGHRRPAALEHGRARSSTRSSASAAGSGSRPGATAHAIFSTVVAESREEVARPRRQVPRAGHVRARGDPRLDAGPGPAPPPRHRRRRGAPLPAPGQPDPVLGPVAAAVAGPARPERARRARAVGPRHLRRPADRPRADRRGRGPRHRPPAAPRPRVLAAEAPRRRPRDPQRARRDVRRRTSRTRSRRSSGRASRPRATRATRAVAASTSCAATGSRAEDRTLLQAAARAVLLSRRGSLADQVIRLERPAAAVARRAAATAAPRPRPDRRRRRRRRAGARVLQRARRLRRRRPRVRHRSWARASRRPAPWLNVIANPSFGFLVSESGRRLHLVREQPREPAHPVVQRPGQRPGRRGDLRPRRRDRRAVEPDGAADPARGARPTSPATAPGYSRFEHAHDGIELDLVQFVPLDEPLKVSVLTIENRSGRPRRLSVTAYAEWVAGHVARRERARGSSPSSTRRPARCSPATRGTPSSAGRVAFLDLGGRQTAWTADRTEFLGRNGAPGPAGRPGARRTGCSGPVGRRPGPVRRAPDELRAAPTARGREVVVLLGEARRAAGGGRRSIQRGRAPDHEADAAGASRRTGTTSRAPSRCGRPTARWTSCSTAGCSTRRSPAGCGRGPRSTRPAAPTASATSSRTSSR